MKDRVLLIVKCNRDRHIVAKVIAKSSGPLVLITVAAGIGTGRGNRVQLSKNAVPLNAPSSWLVQVGCDCGPTLLMDQQIRTAMAAGKSVIWLDPMPTLE